MSGAKNPSAPDFNLAYDTVNSNIEVARCAACGQRAQARHPEQTSDALEVAVQIGPRGARLHAVVTSLWRTCRKPGRDFLIVVTTLLRSPQPQVIELVLPGTPATGPP